MFMNANIRYKQAKKNILPKNNFAISIKESKHPRRISDIIYSDFAHLIFKEPAQS